MDSGKLFLIIIAVLAVGYLVTNNIYVNYDSLELDEENYVCKNNSIELTSNELSEYGVDVRSSPEKKCSSECFVSENWKNYYKEKEVSYCDEGNPICECKASVYTYHIKPLY